MSRTVNPHYTDLAVVLGPNLRFVQFDFEDLQRFAPEVLLGYRVRLATVDSVSRGALRGLYISKLVILDGISQARDFHIAYNEARVCLALSGGKVETYRVHRGSDPVVQHLS